MLKTLQRLLIHVINKHSKKEPKQAGTSPNHPAIATFRQHADILETNAELVKVSQVEL